MQRVLVMQIKGLPLGQETIVQKASEIKCYIFGSTRSIGSVGRGYCEKFMSRHGELTLGTPQIIRRARNEASLEGLQSFFYELCQHIIEQTIKK